MPNQFTIYKSTDASAPTLNGTAGSLLTVLDAILVNGYGSKAAAGWTKPYSNSGNVGCYQNIGSQMCLSINDNGPGAHGGREARITGYETLSAVATGSGQFPNATTSQGVTPYGFWPVRKSSVADGSARLWLCFADGCTFYFFVLTLDSATTYLAFMFGDFYSVAGSADAYRAAILGRVQEGSNTLSNDKLDWLSTPYSNAYACIPRTVGGGGASILANLMGDQGRLAASSGYSWGTMGLYGAQTPNGADNAYYIAPVWVMEKDNWSTRGRMRGFWHLCHPQSSFSDGQTFNGANDTAGKTFQIVLRSGTGGCYCIETSATLETN